MLPDDFAEIYRVRQRLLDAGAVGAVMTGTGSAVFGLFDNTETARSAYETLSADYAACWHTTVTPAIENF